VCRSCHDFCHQNPEEARRTGWIIDSHKISFQEEDQT
jgi:hypothetical protein